MGVPRRYLDLSLEELYAMDSDGIQRLIDLECAYAGLVKVECPTAPVNPKAKLDKPATAYNVCGLLLTDYSEAQIVLNLKSVVTTHYDYNIDYHIEWLEPTNTDIKTVNYYIESDVRKAGQELKEYNRVKAVYDKEYKEFEAFTDKYNEIIASVNEAVGAARWFFRTVEQASEVFKNYLDLANGDVIVAINFFVLTTYQEEIKKRVLMNLGYTEYLPEEAKNDA
jgi:hypothetical protein